MAKTDLPQERPSTWATLKAYGREGLNTLQNYVLKAFPDSMPVRDEPGTLGNPTPQMVTQDLQGRQTYDQRLGDYVQQHGHQQVQSRDRQLEP